MIRLVEGPHHGETLPLLARLHKRVHLSDGSSYFRMHGVTYVADDGTSLPCYLWEEWVPAPLRELPKEPSE